MTVPFLPSSQFCSGIRPLHLFLALSVLATTSWSHDIPNQRVDRSIQATVRPGKLRIDYEVSLTELTLTQDLRALIGTLPGADRSEWLTRYGQVTGPLNAKGFLIHCNGMPVELVVRDYDVVVEEHPRYTFHLEGALPATGRLGIHDTNYLSSEGTSRLAIRGRDGVEIEGDTLPADVSQIPVKPVWQLDDQDERRTRQVEVEFHGPVLDVRGGDSVPRPDTADPRAKLPVAQPEPAAHRMEITSSTERLFGLLDRSAGASWLGLLLIAAGLGAVHAVQPGHGKTLVSAVALGPQARWYQPALLGLATTVAHTGSVLALAAILWWTGASQVAGLHRFLTHVAGFAIAAGGFWRIGRTAARSYDQTETAEPLSGALSLGGLLGLGIAGGLVPCWDAVGLVVLATALGRLGTGVILVISFGIGMALVLVGVGVLAGRLTAVAVVSPTVKPWETRLELASGMILAAIGLVFFLG